MNSKGRIPRWVWVLAAALAAIDPLTHVWLAYGLPEGVAPTGFHIGDTPFFLTSMNLFENGAYSPYATCLSPLGSHSLRYFALPHHWLYGALGLMAQWLHVNPFLFLGMANALSGFAYLIAAYAFLRAAAPRHANLAFLIFTLGGGLGGLLYLVFQAMNALGFEAASCTLPAFETLFHRYARYELIEGPFLSPVLVIPRLYYTLPLALGLVSLTALLRRGRQVYWYWLLPAGAGMLLATYLNARVGVMFGTVAVCWLCAQNGLPWKKHLQLAALFCAPIALALLAVSLQFRLNPTGAANVGELLRRCAWFGSIASLLFWHLFTVPLALAAQTRRMPRILRAIAYGAAGHIAAFAVLYTGHQLYYGNLLAGGDTAAAIAVSDWALLGAAVGALAAWRRSPPARPAKTDWIALWFLIFLAVAISGFGRGWFLRLMPERFLAMLGLPLAILSAGGLARLHLAGWRKTSRALVTAMLACGVSSIAVGSLCFQGPLGQRPGDTAFNWLQAGIMAEEDAQLIAQIDTGTVLAPASLPPLLGDVVVHCHPGVRTVFGQPSLEFSGVRMSTLSQAVQHFFASAATATERRDFVDTWCVDYVLCPQTRPVPPEVLEALRATPWLQPAAQEGEAELFRVCRETAEAPA